MSYMSAVKDALNDTMVSFIIDGLFCRLTNNKNILEEDEVKFTPSDHSILLNITYTANEARNAYLILNIQKDEESHTTEATEESHTTEVLEELYTTLPLEINKDMMNFAIEFKKTYKLPETLVFENVYDEEGDDIFEDKMEIMQKYPLQNFMSNEDRSTIFSILKKMAVKDNIETRNIKAKVYAPTDVTNFILNENDTVVGGLDKGLLKELTQEQKISCSELGLKYLS